MRRSARCCSDTGIVSPSALAVFRLMTSSNFVGVQPAAQERPLDACPSHSSSSPGQSQDAGDEATRSRSPKPGEVAHAASDLVRNLADRRETHLTEPPRPAQYPSR